MPPLANARHEKFAIEIATGKSATEAYALAGYRPSRKNASRLRANEDVAARVAELQAITARSAEITIESICAELDQANQIAMQNGQAAAMVSASTLRAKLAGLLTQKIEVTNVNSMDEADTFEAIADLFVRDLAPDAELLPEQKAEFTALLVEWATELTRYLAGCTPKPTGPTVDPVAVERLRLGLRRPRLTNGGGQKMGSP